MGSGHAPILAKQKYIRVRFSTDGLSTPVVLPPRQQYNFTMSRREIGMRTRDAPRDGRPDKGREGTGRDARYPPPHRDRMRGDSPPHHHRERMRGNSPPRAHRDRVHGDSRGRDGRRETPPGRRVSRSPIRGSRHGLDEGFHTLRARSPDGHRRRSLELHPRRDSPRERRMRSPRMAARATPPPPPPRSPHVAVHPASPRLPMRPGSPHLPMRPGLPRVSMRPGSPRVPMRPGSPRVAMSGQSQLPAAFDRCQPQLAVAFDSSREKFVDRQAMLTSNRNGTLLGTQIATPFTSGNAVKGVEDMLNSDPDESLSSYGMLVPRSIVLEDGTVRTFYSLPPDPFSNSVPPTTGPGLGGKLFPPYADGLTQHGAEHAIPRYVSPDKFTSVERSRGEFISTQEQRFTDRKLSGQNQYITGDRNLSSWLEKPDLEHSTYRRERPLSPYQNAIDGPSQRRASRSPLRDGVHSYGRDGVINSLSRDSYTSEIERSARRVGMERRGSTYAPELSLREGLNSPRGRGPDEDFRGHADRDRIGYARNPRQDELSRAPDEGRLALQRLASSVYDPPDAYPRERGLVRSSEHRDSLMYEQSNGGFHRQVRSPPREASKQDGVYPQRPAFRSDMQMHPSPRRNAGVSPRRMRSLTPPNSRQHNLHEDERRVWKRKYAELGEDPSLDRRLFRPHEPELKRRETGWDVHYDNHLRDRRPSGWDRQDGYFERRPEREEDEFNHGNQAGRRPWGERGGSARRYSSYPEDERRQSDFHDRDEYLQSERPNRSFADKSRLWHGSDMQREMIEREERQIAPDLPENSAEFKQQVHRAFMKYAKTLNENFGQRKKYEEQGKAGMLLCLACGRLSKPFVDTHSLVMHTLQSKKRGLRAEHSGLCKAICSVMGWSSAIEPTGGKSYQNITAEEAKANKEDLILWPPAVLVHNVFAGKMTDGPQGGAGGAMESAVKELLKDSGLSFERTKVAAGRQGTVIIKYMATFSCLHEAEHLHKYFISSSHGRDDWLRVGPAKKESNAGGGPDLVEEGGEKKRVLYGYLALAHDLDKVDLDFQRRCVIRSRKEIEAIAGDILISNKSSD